MNKKILSVEEMMMIFEVFMDEIPKENILFNDYLPKFREEYGVSANSPMEFMLRGFVAKF